MIDLKKIEAMIDQVLETETPESLKAYLEQQKKRDAECGISLHTDISSLSMFTESTILEDPNIRMSYNPAHLDSNFKTQNDYFNTVA